MFNLGIDIGTTSITTIITKNEEIVEVLSDKNEFIKTDEAFSFIQDPKRIIQIVQNQINYFFDKYDSIDFIGVTGQMHGILYTNSNYDLLSPLYTWCDQRGAEIINGKSYKELAYEKTNVDVPIGYGLITHFYNLKNDLVPKCDYIISTVYDYLANYLSHSNKLTLHSSSAASLGFYNLEENEFLFDILKILGIKKKNIPDVTPKIKDLGTYKGAKVYVAIGDNQASYLGATKGEKALLINFGTGSQISISTNKIVKTDNCEIRPYLENDYLIVGASLCGGKSFEALARFYQSITNEPLEDIYTKLTNTELIDTDVEFKPLFLGTRKDPSIKASINGLNLKNFNIENFTISLLNGMVDELYTFYQDMKYVPFNQIVGSGNGLRKNELLQKITEKRFNKKLILNEIKEEAAYGACLYFRR